MTHHSEHLQVKMRGQKGGLWDTLQLPQPRLCVCFLWQGVRGKVAEAEGGYEGMDGR